MHHAGYHWSLRPEGDKWRWVARGREDEQVFMQGLAPSRAIAAAFLVRALSRGVQSQGDA